MVRLEDGSPDNPCGFEAQEVQARALRESEHPLGIYRKKGDRQVSNDPSVSSSIPLQCFPGVTELGELKLELAHFALVLRGLPLKLRPCAPAVDPEGYCENDQDCE